MNALRSQKTMNDNCEIIAQACSVGVNEVAMVIKSRMRNEGMRAKF